MLQTEEAMQILGLTLDESHNESKIKEAWKQLIKQANEAKNTLLDSYEKKCREDEEERVIHERLEAEVQARRLVEEEAMLQAEAEERRLTELALIKKRQQEIQDQRKADKHERQIRNRRKRLPTARAHRSINNNPEGTALFEEIQKFFQDKFKKAYGSKLFTADILDLFIKSRDNTSILELNLFKRHAKKLFLVAWPSAVYSSSNSKRCFHHVRII